MKDDLAGDDRLAPADDQAQADQRQAAVQQQGDAEPVAADDQQNAYGDQCNLYPRGFCHIATLPIGSDSAPKSRVGGGHKQLETLQGMTVLGCVAQLRVRDRPVQW